MWTQGSGWEEAELCQIKQEKRQRIQLLAFDATDCPLMQLQSYELMLAFQKQATYQ